MKKIRTLSVLILLITAIAIPMVVAKKGDGATIQDGTIKDINDNVITTGYDAWGYNYQAHMFNGWYHNSLRPEPPYTDEQSLIDAGKSTTWLVMKWNDAWLSNMDRDEDNLLDRHWGFGSYLGSGAWETNHQWGTYEDEETGEVYSWDYFVKIVALDEMWVSFDDANDNNVLDKYELVYDIDDNLLGKSIWGEFVIIQQVYNDEGTGEEGIEFLTQPAGFGAAG